MKLFDRQFVNVIWDDALLRKPCFYADEMSELIKYVENNNLDYKGVVTESNDVDFQFVSSGRDMGYRFAYYDPNYELKRAYKDGKTIQYQDVSGDWHDCVPNWNTKDKYRVKPTLCYVGIGSQKRLTWDFEPATYNHIYASFENGIDASKWIDAHTKFIPVMRAFEKGLTVEYKRKVKGADWHIASTPSWDLKLRYRVKPVYNSLANKSCIMHPQAKEPRYCSTCEFVDKSFQKEPCRTCFNANKWEPKKRRMTNRELAQWLADGKGQYCTENFGHICDYSYLLGTDNEKVPNGYKIRGWNETEWHEPEVVKEVE